MEPTISLPGNSAAYCPMELRKIQCALLASTEFTIAQAVNVDIRLRMVNNAEMIMKRPAQKDSDPCSPSRNCCRTVVVTVAELYKTPSSVDKSRDMKTILEAYRCVMCNFRSFPFSMAHAKCRRQIEKLSTVMMNSRILSSTSNEVQVLCV